MPEIQNLHQVRAVRLRDQEDIVGLNVAVDDAESVRRA